MAKKVLVPDYLKGNPPGRRLWHLVLVLGLLIVFLSPSLVSSYSVAASPPAINTIDTRYAGYLIQTKNGAQNIKLSTTFIVPTLTCTSDQEYVILDLGIMHYQGFDAGIELDMTCQNGVAFYHSFILQGASSTFLALDSPGEKFIYTASENVATGAVSAAILITDQGEVESSYSVGTSASSSGVEWMVRASGCDPACPAPVPVFTPIKTTGDRITLGSHTGSIGTFLGVKSDSVTEYLLQNSLTGHVVIKPITITSTSSGFSIKWVRAS